MRRRRTSAKPTAFSRCRAHSWWSTSGPRGLRASPTRRPSAHASLPPTRESATFVTASSACWPRGVTRPRSCDWWRRARRSSRRQPCGRAASPKATFAADGTFKRPRPSSPRPRWLAPNRKTSPSGRSPSSSLETSHAPRARGPTSPQRSGPVEATGLRAVPVPSRPHQLPRCGARRRRRSRWTTSARSSCACWRSARVPSSRCPCWSECRRAARSSMPSRRGQWTVPNGRCGPPELSSERLPKARSIGR